MKHLCTQIGLKQIYGAARTLLRGLLLALFTVCWATPPAGAASTDVVPLNHPGGITYWSFLEGATDARRLPHSDSRIVGRLRARTYERTTELVVVVAETENRRGELWYQVRLPVRPNNTLGWVREDRIGELRSTFKHLRIDRATFTATLIERGRVLFRGRIGVGKSAWPTPAGEFYVRSRLPNSSGIYGPFAFGTSATSSVLTDWPGGGYIGLHGTDQPELLPGRVSHGCVRFRNRDILRLAALVGVGTPITIV